ncbi:aspartyl-phosphate phosphatase Spo0E family protein [Bacillus coahuilensis]|uniref:aspartyl-phosphate phosphatase Spo0E family protein n=1 Tax=Bacillus coahuilensis TaxID=408580 RepID=UPI000307174E|nr:aspartyl-phosphate phosphatase Spo0E family protein [Bacillus coahuilensis]
MRIQLKTNETHTLDFLVQIKRKEMIYHGLNHGLSHPRTIRLSQELDILLNQYGI